VIDWVKILHPTRHRIRHFGTAPAKGHEKKFLSGAHEINFFSACPFAGSIFRRRYNYEATLNVSTAHVTVSYGDTVLLSPVNAWLLDVTETTTFCIPSV